MNRAEKRQIKILMCLLGIIILFVLGIILLVRKAPIEEPPVHIPVVKHYYNVWITEVADGYIHAYDGSIHIHPLGEAWAEEPPAYAREQIADLTLTDGVVTELKVKNTDKISGKVLRVISGVGVELEEIGVLSFAENAKMYKLFDKLKLAGEKDIRVGYAFCDFVLENGEICGVLVTRDEAMEYIRVQIKTSDYALPVHDVVKFTVDTDFALYYESGEGMTAEPHYAGEVVEIMADSDYLKKGRLTIVPAALTGKITLLSVERSQGNPSYRGTLELAAEEAGIYVINELLLEEYLYSVVPSEMPSDYPLEALKAQAICARTYAYGHMLTSSGKLYGAHVDDSSSYQVYNNIPEHEKSTTAVRETGGQLLYVYEDAGETLADTYYYSTSCGHGTESDVWKSSSEALKYLPARRISSVATLSAESVDTLYTANSLMDEDIFRSFITQSFAADYESQEPWYRWEYEVEEVDRERMLSALQSRYEANKKLVLTRNKKGEFESKPIEKLEEIRELVVVRRNEGGVADELLIETKNQTIKVISEYNIRTVLCDGVTKVVRQDGSKVSMPNLLPSAFFVITTGKDDGNVVGYTIVGGGFGHGVGMSQNGARSMAQQNLSATEILSFFYQGSNVKQIY